MFRSFNRKAAAAALAAGMVLALSHIGAAEAAGHKVCRNYADSAVWQHNRNVNARCGYGGLRWHYAWQLHYNWCRGAPKWRAKEERRIRRRALRACGAL